jgi:hypothetical protein
MRQKPDHWWNVVAVAGGLIAVAAVPALWPAIDRALAWIDGPGDRDRDGFVDEVLRRASADLAILLTHTSQGPYLARAPAITRRRIVRLPHRCQVERARTKMTPV